VRLVQQAELPLGFDCLGSVVEMIVEVVVAVQVAVFQNY